MSRVRNFFFASLSLAALVMLISAFFSLALTPAQALAEMFVSKTVFSENELFSLAEGSIFPAGNTSPANGDAVAVEGFAVTASQPGDRFVFYANATHSLYAFGDSGKLEMSVKLCEYPELEPAVPFIAGIAASKSGNIIVYDSSNFKVSVFSAELKKIKTYPATSRGGQSFGTPALIRAHGDDGISFFDMDNARTVFITPDSRAAAAEEQSESLISASDGFAFSFSGGTLEISHRKNGDGKFSTFGLSHFSGQVVKANFIGKAAGKSYFFSVTTRKFDLISTYLMEADLHGTVTACSTIAPDVNCERSFGISMAPSGRLVGLKKYGPRYSVVEYRKTSRTGDE